VDGQHFRKKFKSLTFLALQKFKLTVLFRSLPHLLSLSHRDLHTCCTSHLLISFLHESPSLFLDQVRV